MHAIPVGQRRSGDDDRSEQFRPHGCEHHDRPAGLTIADDAGFAVGLRVQRDHLLEEHRLGASDVLDGLAGHRVRQEADEVAWVAGLHGHADFAVGLEAADTRTVPGARIDDHKRPARWIDFDAFGRHHAHEPVVDRPLERAAVDNDLERNRAREAQFRRDARGIDCRALASRPRTKCSAAQRRRRIRPRGRKGVRAY